MVSRIKVTTKNGKHFHLSVELSYVTTVLV